MEKRKIFRNLKSLNEAWDELIEQCPPSLHGIEHVELENSLGRTLGTSIYAGHDVPFFDRCAMDGYAVRAEDTYQANEVNPVLLKLIGSIKAGYVFQGKVKEKTTVEIATGSPLPFGANAVIMVENTSKRAENVLVYSSVAINQHVQSLGSDLQRGELVLTKNTVLKPREIGLLSALGIREVPVIKIPKICIFSSGDEIIEPGEQLSEGLVHDINSNLIIAMLKEIQVNVDYKGIIEDNYQNLKEKLVQALKKYDIVMISGGTSAGIGDILYLVIDDLGSPGVLTHGIKIKPGKPTLIGAVGKKTIFGLPGYPASSFSVFSRIVLPYIRLKVGLKKEESNLIIPCIIKSKLRSVLGRTQIRPVQIIKKGDTHIAFPTPGTSGSISLFSKSDGTIEIPSNVETLEANTQVNVKLSSKNLKLPTLQIAGSHCPMLYQLKENIEASSNENVRILTLGSTGGMLALIREECNISAAHLPDYKNFDLNNYIGISGYLRQQGFIVKKGNPKNIQKIEDLKNPEVRFLNRNNGSGTRMLIDKLIESSRINNKNITGYNSIARSHQVATNIIQSGKADVSVGLEFFINSKLEFIQIKAEEYNFFINKAEKNSDSILKFISFLKSDNFQKTLEKAKGYKPSPEIGNFFEINSF